MRKKKLTPGSTAMLQFFVRLCQKSHALLQFFVRWPGFYRNAAFFRQILPQYCNFSASLPKISRNAAFFRQPLSETSSIAVTEGLDKREKTQYDDFSIVIYYECWLSTKEERVSGK
ncbi:MAG: hypothetical protein IJ106_11975 [Parasporobacterium sp.]|nr:hypothetical protein [Parasporobacterium sp.]